MSGADDTKTSSFSSDFFAEKQSGATIRVTRDKTRSPDRRRAYMVFAGGDKIGDLAPGETAEFPVEPGDHVVWISVDFERSRQLSVSLTYGDVVHFLCRSRGKTPAEAYVDLYLADPRDQRIQVRHADDGQPQDMAVKHRAVTRDGQVLAVWAHKSGYLRSLDPGSSSSGGDSFVVEIAFYILVIPVLAGLRLVRHRFFFKRGWSVGVVRNRGFLWPEKVRLERFPDEARARARAAEIWSEVENWPSP